MTSDFLNLPLLALIFAVAALYSAVGHGGASGYLAVLSLFAFAPQQMSSTALVLNIFVSALAFWTYARAGHTLPKFTWLIVAAALPLSFAGGMLPVKPQIYAILLGFALVIAAFRLFFVASEDQAVGFSPPNAITLLTSGAGIGLMSGIVGVGGGIFLSPLAVLRRWAPMKSVATLSAIFILLNSITGLLGRWASGKLELESSWLLLCAAVLGGLTGSYLGAEKLQTRVLRGLLAVVLIVAAAKLIWTAL